jgi:hypothetical protein
MYKLVLELRSFLDLTDAQTPARKADTRG